VETDHLHIIKEGSDYIVALRYIYSIFIHTKVKISLDDIYRLAEHCKVYLIDARGYLVGKVINFEKK